MKNQKKTIISIIAFIIFIAISGIVYNQLKEDYMPTTMMNVTEENKEAIEQNNETTEQNKEITEENKEAAEEKLILAPNFSMEDEEGNSLQLSDFLGKPIVLNFWASWCPPCKEEMPDFDNAYTEYGEDIHFIMLNVTDGSRETKESATKFLEEKTFSFPIYFDIDLEGGNTYGITSLPTTLFIDKNGYLITGSIGMINESSLKLGIEMIMEAE